MARAAGLSKARIDQIVREVAEGNQRQNKLDAQEKVPRHSRSM